MTPDEITRSPQAGPRQRPSLTRREREVLGLLAGGMSGAQIASALFLSPETVRTHIRNAMGKLGASTRSQAVALALQNDEITSETELEATPAAGGRSGRLRGAEPRAHYPQARGRYPRRHAWLRLFSA